MTNMKGDIIDNYRGWNVYVGWWPAPSYYAIHPDYDASYEGPEVGWVDNGLHANGRSLDELFADIDEKEEEWRSAFR